ncbi:MAG: magnesium/cobalt transporter CorA [Nitrospirota bacterium]
MSKLLIGHRDGRVEERTSPVAIEEGLKIPDTLFWLNLEATEVSEIERLGDLFGFHPLTIEDCIKLNQRPKLEDFETYLFVVLHFCVFKSPTGEIGTKELHIFLGPNYLITVQGEPIEPIRELYERCKKDPAIWEKGCDFIFYLVGDSIADSYFPLLDTIGEDIDRLEDAILLSPKKEDLDRVFTLKQDMIFLRKIVSPMREVFNNLSKKDSLINEKNLLYFRDVHGLLLMAYEVIDSYRDMVGNALEVYLSTISNRMTEIMKRLTIIATIFMPLSFITGFFGMNFTLLPFGNPWLLLGVLIITAILPVSMLLWFYRQKWF